MTFWNKSSFKALQRAWYQRLKDEGFQDAEKLINGRLVLAQSASHPYKGHNEVTIQEKETYFMELCQCVYNHEFDDEVDRLVLTWYSQGRKIKEICEDLDQRGELRARNTVRFIIRRYEIAWGLRNYRPNQLNQFPRG